MERIYFKGFISTANIYSLSKFKDLEYRDTWLVVTAKEIIVFKSDDDGNIIFNKVQES
jgi:hypothetical protein